MIDRPKTTILVTAMTACLLAASFTIVAATPAARAQATAGKEDPKLQENRGGGKAARFLAGAWEVRCLATGSGRKAQCMLGRSIIEPRSRKRLLGISISGDRKRMELLLPHGIDLTRPPVFLVDGKERGRAVYVTSRPQGLFARMKLTDGMLKALTTGKTMGIMLHLPNGRPLLIRSGLDGFAEALRKLR